MVVGARARVGGGEVSFARAGGGACAGGTVAGERAGVGVRLRARRLRRLSRADEINECALRRLFVTLRGGDAGMDEGAHHGLRARIFAARASGGGGESARSHARRGISGEGRGNSSRPRRACGGRPGLHRRPARTRILGQTFSRAPAG